MKSNQKCLETGEITRGPGATYLPNRGPDQLREVLNVILQNHLFLMFLCGVYGLIIVLCLFGPPIHPILLPIGHPKLLAQTTYTAVFLVRTGWYYVSVCGNLLFFLLLLFYSLIIES